MSYVYHVLPSNLEGTVLYPLNQLKDINIELYNFHVQKYNNRDHLLSRDLPYLDVKWNDVLFFSSINPEVIYENLREIGFKVETPAYIKIPIEDLDKSKTIVYHYTEIRADKNSPIDQYSRLSDIEYEELLDVPKITLNYFKRCYNRNIGIRPHAGIPHILMSGSLDIKPYLINKECEKI